jgi:hypothetical protein
MPITLTHRIDAPDFGQARRHDVQRRTFVALLWARAETQETFAKLIRVTALDRPVRRLQRAVTQQASHDAIVAADRTLFDAILTHRKTIGHSLSDYVRSLFGRYVPWLAAELVALFVAQVQASASGRQLAVQSALDSAAPPAIVYCPSLAGKTRREARALLRHLQQAQLQQLTASHRGRVPEKKAPSLARDAAWFYLHVVEHRSVHSLAKEYITLTRPDALGSYDGRSLIQRAVHNTARRLHLPATRT